MTLLDVIRSLCCIQSLREESDNSVTLHVDTELHDELNETYAYINTEMELYALSEDTQRTQRLYSDLGEPTQNEQNEYHVHTISVNTEVTKSDTYDTDSGSIGSLDSFDTTINNIESVLYENTHTEAERDTHTCADQKITTIMLYNEKSLICNQLTIINMQQAQRLHSQILHMYPDENEIIQVLHLIEMPELLKDIDGNAHLSDSHTQRQSEQKQLEKSTHTINYVNSIVFFLYTNQMSAQEYDDHLVSTRLYRKNNGIFNISFDVIMDNITQVSFIVVYTTHNDTGKHYQCTSVKVPCIQQKTQRLKRLDCLCPSEMEFINITRYMVSYGNISDSMLNIYMSIINKIKLLQNGNVADLKKVLRNICENIVNFDEQLRHLLRLQDNILDSLQCLDNKVHYLKPMYRRTTDKDVFHCLVHSNFNAHYDSMSASKFTDNILKLVYDIRCHQQSKHAHIRINDKAQQTKTDVLELYTYILRSAPQELSSVHSTNNTLRIGANTVNYMNEHVIIWKAFSNNVYNMFRLINNLMNYMETCRHTVLCLDRLQKHKLIPGIFIYKQFLQQVHTRRQYHTVSLQDIQASASNSVA